MRFWPWPQARAELAYSDGSQAARAVDWNMAQLEAIAQEASEGNVQGRPDTRTVEACRIRQSVYPVPFAVERADPSVFAWDFNGKPMFMFIATDDTDGNCVDPNDGRHPYAAAHRRLHRSAFRRRGWTGQGDRSARMRRSTIAEGSCR